jgi:hypothetical protein
MKHPNNLPTYQSARASYVALRLRANARQLAQHTRTLSAPVVVPRGLVPPKRS